jgi:FtsP/CotA-like multicopper oxidase with cupredoxin domain
MTFSMISRRRFLAGATALAGAAMLPWPLRADGAPVELVSKVRPFRLPGCSAPTPIWSYGEGWPLVLRIPRAQPFEARLTNRLAEYTSVHWHGVRVPNAMDGVPYMTQDPVQPDDSFTYRFTPPDPGTFFFHPHCDTLTALGSGLAGVLVIEDPREAGLFDVDEVLALKDWRVKPDGSFDVFTTTANAAAAGTFGALRTANAQLAPTIKVAPGARVRLRLVNLDVARIPMLGVKGAEARIIATDGNACDPMPVRRWRLGPAMRADVAFVAPSEPGATVTVEDVFANPLVVLARIVTEGAPAARQADLAALKLPAAELPVADLKTAKELSMTLQAGAADPALQKWLDETGLGPDALCLSSQILWSINGKSWPGMTRDTKPPPLAELSSNASYVMEIFNGSRFTHPMHLHGHTFRVLGSNKRKLPQHWADTVLVFPEEKVRIAFVGGKPGDWMFHCHIIEHQETGMMGYLRVA